MSYWRMQLHPNDAGKSAYYASQSLAANFIGLDFTNDVGDLLADNQQDILNTEKDYVAFAKDMKAGDKVLIIVHHFPFAVCTVDGEYNYIRRIEPELGVWFRHFRRVKDVIYFADYNTNSKSWEQFIMTDTISTLIDKSSMSYVLIDKMVNQT